MSDVTKSEVPVDDVSIRPVEDTDAYPKKYWWVILILVPVILALIPTLPSLLKKPDNASDARTTITQSGTSNSLQTGGINISNSDLSSKLYVTTVSIIAR